MDGTRLFNILCLLCFFVFQAVTVGSRTICKGQWAKHSCAAGNGKRTEIEELLGYEKKNTPDDEDLIPSYVSDLRNLGEVFGDREDNAASRDGDDDSTDPYLAAEVRTDDREKERRLNALITRILLRKRQQLLDD